MLKKPLILLSAFTLLTAGLCSCQSGGDNTPVKLLFGTKEFIAQEEVDATSHMKKLADKSALDSLIEHQDNFILIVLGDAHETCGCWNDFHESNIVRYQKETNVLFYYLYQRELKGEDYGLDLGSEKATIGIFRNGQLAYQNDDGKETSDFNKKYSVFHSWMEARVALPRVYFLTRDQLNSLYEDTLPFTIYFSRQTCGDCAYMQSHAYRSYFESHPTGIEDSYVIDLDAVGIGSIEKDGIIYFRSTSANATPEQKEAQAQYEAFKAEFGLVETKDNPAGYNEGYVPTIFHINPEGNGKKTGDVIDLSGVFYNDEVQEGIIVDTYFTEDRLQLECLSYLRESSIENKVLLNLPARGNRRETNAAYHDPILEAFLNASIGTL